MTITNSDIPTYIMGANGNTIRCIVYEIGTWNMDTTTEKQIDCSDIDGKEIIFVQAIIIDNNQTSRRSLEYTNHITNDCGGSVVIDDNVDIIYLSRAAGHEFDGPSYNRTDINRGYCAVWYIE